MNRPRPRTGSKQISTIYARVAEKTLAIVKKRPPPEIVAGMVKWAKKR